ncbi:pentatricopeptide repeat-containing protein At1g12300, mitochondrial-like [Helianthus annuus]|uniref:pentatricopeptide repeat-containing protein At1g12300, mitochondrial-like n=1 Tax=Helianthus annuus TaxID=4232 RepID=UPI0016532010|nr:pentatricopeptide repeat-containing protein At1g12300, mitochondrial-like [Helianthus annuus]
MKDEKISPDTQTFSILVDAFCKEGKVKEAEAVIDIMVERGEVQTSKRGKLDIAKALFHDLALKGVQPSARTFNIMISGLCGEGQLKEAEDMFLKMDESGFPPDTVTCNVFLQGYIKNQHYDDVGMLLHEMDGRGYSLDASTLSLLIHQIAAGSLDRTSKLSVWYFYSLSVEKYPDNPMLGTREFVNGKHGAYKWLTYKQVYDKVIHVGNAIRSCGVEPEGRCGIYGANCAEWVISMEACYAHGLYCVPLYDTLAFADEKKICEL